MSNGVSNPKKPKKKPLKVAKANKFESRVSVLMGGGVKQQKRTTANDQPDGISRLVSLHLSLLSFFLSLSLFSIFHLISFHPDENERERLIANLITKGPVGQEGWATSRAGQVSTWYRQPGLAQETDPLTLLLTKLEDKC